MRARSRKAARLVTPPADDLGAAVDQLDAATALLVHVGHAAGELRGAIGMDSAGGRL